MDFSSGKFTVQMRGVSFMPEKFTLWFKTRISSLLPATKLDIQKIENRIMKAIELLSQFAKNQAAFNVRQAAAIDTVVAAQTGIGEDFKALNQKIIDLQNTAGDVTPEDQALINQLEADGAEMATKFEAVAAALKALDEATPPAVPNPS